MNIIRIVESIMISFYANYYLIFILLIIKPIISISTFINKINNALFIRYIIKNLLFCFVYFCNY